MSGPASYTVTVDRDACDGVFACLVRDPRFVEDDDGLAGIDADDAEAVERTEASVTATFADDRIDDAQQAAEACPLDAITVETAETPGVIDG
ncbi:ferredoxin [Halobaculum sp. WSA2]|uniref:Ferredoxin n=1 Tax=Halobaculum saliterrae TaxID=2073113 RepID=A0A6B0SSN6_9EURY|nr:ferredoxin [Halobaculum saliterrae]MXR40606.1 ferredoxin [Halobaculum saliterrae]